MNVDIRHSPSFAVARVHLGPKEQFKAESGAMVMMSAGVTMSASTGGVMQGLKRSFLGGESLFVTTFTAPSQGGWVDVAHTLVGDIMVANISGGDALSITRGCWLASSAGIELDTKWGGFRNLFGGEGGFLVRTSGNGDVIMACYGAMDTVELAAGETVTIDTGHVVAFEPTIQSTLRKAAGGMVQTFKTGEGLVFDFTGPGWVLTQSRNPSALEAWIRDIMPGQQGGAGGGVLGGFLGGR